MALCRRILTAAFCAMSVRALQHPQPTKDSESPLPSLRQVLYRPRHVLKSMSSHVEELAANLLKLQSRSTNEVSEQKSGYEEKLRAQRAAATKIKRRNAAIQLHTDSLRNDSLAVKSRADGLVKGSRRLVALLNAIHENFTDAGVVLANVLQEAHEKMSNSSKLAVLQELAENDARQQQEKETQHRFDEIENPGAFALLQVGIEPSGTRVNSHKEAEELVQSLMASLGSVSEEQNKSTVSLQEQFENEWEAGVKRENDLLDTQAQLNATEAHEQERNTLLHAAYDHALATNTRLKARVHAIRRFAQKVSSRQIPEAHKEKQHTPKYFAKRRKGVYHRRK